MQISQRSAPRRRQCAHECTSNESTRHDAARKRHTRRRHPLAASLLAAVVLYLCISAWPADASPSLPSFVPPAPLRHIHTAHRAPTRRHSTLAMRVPTDTDAGLSVEQQSLLKDCQEGITKGDLRDVCSRLESSGGLAGPGGDVVAKRLLNSLSVYNDRGIQALESAQSDISHLFRILSEAGALKGYGLCGTSGCWPVAGQAETNVELQNANIEKYTNFTIDKLTPKGSGVFWSVAGVAFALAQIALLPPETLNILVPLECGVVLVDSLFFRSVLSESVARVVFPPYQERIVKHEAGHFLIGYLLGAPIQRCIVTVPQLFKEKALVAGQGGTIFFVPEIKEEVMRGQLRRETIDRLSIITMAGIAAEALQFGNAEGGRSDEAALRLFLGRDIFPPWSLPRVTLQARWAVTQAVLLLKEYSQAYDNLVEALRQGKPVGDCVEAIERGLPDGARDAIQRRQDMRQMTAPSLPVGVGGAPPRSGSFIRELLKMPKQNGDGGEG